MANILVVTGSARVNSANTKVVELVKARVEAKGDTAIVADLAAFNLPFFDAPVPPTSPDFTPEHESVKEWTAQVADADAVVFVTPEYNHNLSALQKNAIDWIGKEWEAKPIALVGYGWTSGAAKAHEAAREALAVNLKANVSETAANFFFMKDLHPDGVAIDETAVNATIDAVLEDVSSVVRDGASARVNDVA